MSRIKMAVGAVGATVVVAGMTTAGLSGLAQASPQPAETVLAGSAVSFTSHVQAIGDVAGSTQLSVQLWLRPQISAAVRFATAVSTPGNALYHRYLSPATYTAQFGATRAQASRVASWLRGQGFTAVHTDSQRNYVRATAPVSRIDAAFRTQVKLYKSSAAVNAGRYTLRANASALSVPASLAGSVLGVTGIDNAAPALPMDRLNIKMSSRTRKGAAPTGACSQYYGQNDVTGLPEKFGTTTFPTEVCGYTAGQLRAAYGARAASSGKGQTIALIELGLTKDMFLTLQDYAAANGIAAPSAKRYEELSLGKNNCGDPANIEEQLDVESSYDMAPGANQIVIGGDACNEGDFGLQGLFDADLAVIDGPGGHPLATITSNSWDSGGENQAPQLTSIEHAYLVRAAAVGVGMYFSSGDSSGVAEPGSDPFSTAVGGTTLGIGASNNRLFETGWSTAVSLLESTKWKLQGEQGAAGGGPSVVWRQPAYQVGVVPHALSRGIGNRGGPVRSVPDISADADQFTGMAVGILSFSKGSPPAFGEILIGGTSLATPLVAGMVTAAQQGLSAPFGFANPVLYKLSGTGAYHDALPLGSTSPSSYRGTFCDAATCRANLLTTFDDQSERMAGYNGQVTLPGYDNMTGLGTPNGQNFIKGLHSLG
ncbi:MAG TPA: protease pro-enzyme activation domain-containing protein [Streptosporangiaceae bacterium]